MDEAEFRRLLLLFPVVRSCDYHAESEQSRESTSKSAESGVQLKEWQDAWDEGDTKDMDKEHDAFWEKLKLVAERKVGAIKAEKFCKAFQRVHKKLVYELSLDAAKTFLNSS